MSRLVTSASQFGMTENGALTYVTSGSNVLNLFAMGGALRNRSSEEIIDLVDKAWNENPLQTIETLLYIRDIRGGQGEKRVFRVAIEYLIDKVDCNSLFDAIVEVGSWKDIVSTFTVGRYAPYVKKHWRKNTSPDLMYKWLPSIGGSSNKDAETLASCLGLTPKQYRKVLSMERAALKLVETKMCQNNWGEIDYEHVPSKAALIYKDAFNRHDPHRYSSFIAQANKADGSVNINTDTLAPYELTRKYAEYWNSNVDPTIEAMWKNLPNYCDDSNSLVVADTSASMIGTPMAIATSLAIYFAERNTGIFHNEFVTFSARPRFYHFNDGETLCSRVNKMVKLNICENTNLQATFDLILKAAVDNHISEDEMPKNLYIISDMEFDSCTYTHGPKTNFEVIKEKYLHAGYKMPNIIFWNVNSRQNNVPVKINEDGVALVSGSSASTFQMAISGELNPMKFMIEAIEKPKYKKLAEKMLK